MSIHLLLAATLVSGMAMAQAPAVAEAKSKVEGRVTNAAGEPVRRANIRLTMIPTGTIPSIADITNMKTFSAESGEDGRFSLTNLDAGRYMAAVTRTGFVNANLPVVVTAGQTADSLAIKLVPQGLIAGRVTDEYGDPMPQAQVTVYRRSYGNGRWQLQQVQSAAAGADGVFSVGGLVAGTFYVSADDSLISASAFLGRQSAGDAPQESYITTYYPNSSVASGASGFEVAAGAEIRGIEIRMRKARVFRVRGKVVASEGAVPTTMLVMVPSEGITSATGLTRNMTMLRGQDGTFEFSRMLPGTYVLQIQGGMGAIMAAAAAAGGGTPAAVSARPMSGRQIVTVTDRNLDDVVFQVGPGAEIAGTIRGLAGQARAFITLTARDGLPMASPNAQSQADGSFLLKDVPPGPYRLDVNAPGVYVKTVRYNGQDVTRKPIDVGFGSGGPLEITLASDGAVLTGVIRDEKGDAVPRVSVSLWQPGTELNFSSTTGPNGGFRFQSVPPGEYRLAAWEQVEQGLLNASEFRSQFDGQATTVKLTASGQATADPKLVKRSAIDAAIAKLP